MCIVWYAALAAWLQIAAAVDDKWWSCHIFSAQSKRWSIGCLQRPIILICIWVGYVVGQQHNAIHLLLKLQCHPAGWWMSPTKLLLESAFSSWENIKGKKISLIHAFDFLFLQCCVGPTEVQPQQCAVEDEPQINGTTVTKQQHVEKCGKHKFNQGAWKKAQLGEGQMASN